MRSFVLTVILALAVAASVHAREQKFIEGLWLGVEDGGVIALIAWAESVRYRPWKMANGSLEDAPVIPRTYRILSSMPAWKVGAVVVATPGVFVKDSDRMETISLPFSATKLSTTGVESRLGARDQSLVRPHADRSPGAREGRCINEGIHRRLAESQAMRLGELFLVQ